MQFNIEVRQLAALDIVEAYDWYEMQKPGLGLQFLDDVEKFYRTLLRNPESFSFYKRPVRQGRLKKFPYTVVYEIFNEVIVIYSVFMIRKDPASRRLK